MYTFYFADLTCSFDELVSQCQVANCFGIMRANHISCLPSDHCCTICKEPLKQLIEVKINHFNEGLLKNAKVESDDDSSDSETDDDTATVANNETNSTNAEQYYTSGVWEQKVDSILSAIGEVDQPQHPNAQASYAHTPPQASTVQIHSLM